MTSFSPPSGEHQAPLSSDSDTSIIMGVEVSMSEVDLSMEHECEGGKSWANWSWEKKAWITRKRRTRAGQSDRGHPEEVTSQKMGKWAIQHSSTKTQSYVFNASVDMLLARFLAVTPHHFVGLTAMVTGQPITALTLWWGPIFVHVILSHP